MGSTDLVVHLPFHSILRNFSRTFSYPFVSHHHASFKDLFSLAYISPPPSPHPTVSFVTLTAFVTSLLKICPEYLLSRLSPFYHLLKPLLRCLLHIIVSYFIFYSHSSIRPTLDILISVTLVVCFTAHHSDLYSAS